MKTCLKLFGNCCGSTNTNTNTNSLDQASFLTAIQRLPQPSLKDLEDIMEFLDKALVEHQESESDSDERLRLCVNLCREGSLLSDFLLKAQPQANDQEKQDMIVQLIASMLEGAGYSHVAAAGLSLIAFALRIYVDSRKNQSDYRDLLHEMHKFLMKFKRAIQHCIANPGDSSEDLHKWFKDTILIVVKVAMKITIGMGRSSLSRCLYASNDKDEVSGLKENIKSLYLDTILEMAMVNQQSVSPLGPLQPKIVGVEDQMIQIMDLIAYGESRSNNEATRCVLLMGMGGIGKSEIAGCVYSKLRDLRGEKIRQHRINLPLNESELKVQKKMLKGLMRKTIIKNDFNTCEVGMAEISSNLKSLDEPVFLLVDNLNLISPTGSEFTTTTKESLKQLLPEAQYFPTGSTVVVTTREQEETTSALLSMGFEIKKIQVQCLGDEAARSLLYASMSVNDANDVPICIRNQWEKRLLKACGGWPLALKHAGGKIRCGCGEGIRDEDVWKKIVESLEEGKLVGGSLYNMLKSSIMTLNKECKAAYLAIVQYYEGKEWEEVEDYVGYGEMNVLWQHFIVQKLPIVCKQRGCINILSIHDVYKGYGLNLIRDQEAQCRMNDKIITKWDDELTKEIDIMQDSTLICQKLETKYKMSKHLKFELPHSYQQTIPWSWLQNCTNLITMELHFKREHQENNLLPITPSDDEKAQEFCRSLPQNVLRLQIVSWESLTRLFSIQHCHKLKWVSLEDFPNLNTLQLSSPLCSLSLQHCPMLSLPQEFFSHIHTLRYLNIKDCDACCEIIPQYLPQSLQQLCLGGSKDLQSLSTASFANITSLKHLFVDGCSGLADISLHNMTSLESLYLNGCTKMQILELQDLTSLQYLDLGNSRFWLKQIKISNLSSLKILVSDDTESSKMAGILNMANTKRLKLCSYKVLENLDLNGMMLLEDLFLDDCINLKSMQLGNPESLKNLWLDNCKNLDIPDFSCMVSLNCLTLNGWTHLETLPNLNRMMSLEELSLNDCINLKSIQPGNPASLKKLWLSRCNSMEIPDFLSMASLEVLWLNGWSQLETLPNLNRMTSLEEISLDDCINLKSIQPGNPASLKKLWLSRCNSMEIPDFLSMASLEVLWLNGWSQLETLPNLNRMMSLEVLSLDDCINLKSIQLGNSASLKKLALRRCNSMEIPDFLSMASLEGLGLDGWSQLETLPNLNRMMSLEVLSLDDCINLKSIQLGNPASLKKLLLRRCNSMEIPDFLSMASLEVLYLDGWSQLETLPNLNRMMSLEVLSLDDCINLKSILLGNPASLKKLLLRRCNSMEIPDFLSMASLEVLYLDGWSQLETLPNLNRMTSLEEISLDDCINLKSIQLGNPASLKKLWLTRCNSMEIPDFSSMASLEVLWLNGWSKLETLPNLNRMMSLEVVSLDDCINLKSIQLGNPSSLKKLLLRRCNSMEIPDFSSMASLAVLYLDGWSQLETLPNLHRMMSLEVLSLDDCINLKNIQLGNPASLKKLLLRRCNSMEIPDFSSMASLEVLWLNGWSQLETLPNLNRMTSLEEISLDDCINLKSIQHGNPASLKKLWLSRCNSMEIPDFSSMASLEVLYLDGWSKLETLPNLNRMMSLEVLSLDDCINLKSIQLGNPASLKKLLLRRCNSMEIPDFSSMASLEVLWLNGWSQLETLPNLNRMTSLEEISLDDCINLKSIQHGNPASLKKLWLSRCNSMEIPDFLSMASLEVLYLDGWSQLETLPNLHRMMSLEVLSLDDCINLKSIQLGNPASLKKLWLTRCNSMEIPDFSSMASLEVLWLNGWSKLETLPNLNRMMSLEVLSLDDCINLKSIQLGNPASLKKLLLRRCNSMEIPDFSSMASLEVLWLNGWSQLETLPNLNRMTSLEEISLDDCINLKSIELGNPASLKKFWLSRCNSMVIPDFSSMVSLELLYLDGWSQLETLPNLNRMMSLEVLSLDDCINLKSIQLGNPASLNKLWLSRCNSMVIPDFSSMASLEVLWLNGWSQLETLPNLNRMMSLEELSLDDCINLKSIQVGNPASLKKLVLRRCNSMEIPDFSSMASLEVLWLNGWSQLETLPNLNRMMSLEVLSLDDCINLKSIQLGNPASLRMLALRRCNSMEIPDFSSMASLEALGLDGWSQLETLPNLNRMMSLEELSLNDCINLKSIQPGNPASLKKLGLSRCNSMEIPDFSSMASLEVLWLNGWSQLETLPNLNRMMSLEELSLDDCINLKSIQVGNPASLKKLILRRCNSMEIPDFSSMASLEVLYLDGWSQLETLPNLHRMMSLEELSLDDCINLKSIQLGNPASLKKLLLRRCNSMEIPDFSSMASLELLYLDGCTTIERLGLATITSLQLLSLNGCTNLEYLELGVMASLLKLESRDCEKLKVVKRISKQLLE